MVLQGKLSRFLMGVLLIFIIMYWTWISYFSSGETSSFNESEEIIYLMNNDEAAYYETEKGKVRVGQLIEQIYSPLGYEYIGQTKQNNIPVIKRKQAETCDQIFDAWLTVAENATTIIEPLMPNQEPSGDFTLKGHSRVLHCFMNDTFNNNDDAINKLSKDRSWDRKFIEETVEQSRIDINRNTDMKYKDSVSVYQATKYYNISGQMGTVIGSFSPWVEIILLVNGVKHIVTVDYQKVVTTHPKISFLLAQDLAKGHYMYENNFDFAVSFSSVEHSGLGRYGDPLDPFGDVKEIQKIRCMLKPGGLLFLGLPVGRDTLGNNCHRIYGRLRLPFMFEGFKLVDTFGVGPNPFTLGNEHLSKTFPGVNHDQYTFVLRKTAI